MNTVAGKNEFWSPNVDLQTLSSRLEINERTVSIEDSADNVVQCDQRFTERFPLFFVLCHY